MVEWVFQEYSIPLKEFVFLSREELQKFLDIYVHPVGIKWSYFPRFFDDYYQFSLF